MAYQIQRKAKLEETLELLNRDGTIAHTLVVDLDLDKAAKEFTQRYNAVVRAEQALKSVPVNTEEPVPMTAEQAQQTSEAVEELGTAIVEIIQFVFGEESTKIILAFYENKHMELCTDILPFILTVVAPAIKKQAETQQKRLAENYKISQKRKFGVI